MREFVEVSPEMTLLLGTGALGAAPAPAQSIALMFDIDCSAPTLRFEAQPDCAKLGDGLVLLIQRAAYERVGGRPLEQCESGAHLPSALRAIVIAIRECSLSGETRKIYRLGKSIELLCETIRSIDAGELVPLASEGVLSAEDTRRVIAARRIIDERWSEKLTLDGMARACGLNRAKLTRGFREVFNCTVAEALAERRLSHASRMLRTTDLPVSSIGYENGYLNNASFARAFGRRFGLSPSDFRACQAAA